MKILLFFLLSASAAFASDDTFISGNNPFSVTVMNDQGLEVTYKAPAFNSGVFSKDWSGESLNLDFGVRAMCGETLGELSQNLEIIVAVNGSKKTLHIEKSSRGRKVLVGGGCPQSTEELSEQLSIWTQNGKPLVSP